MVNSKSICLLSIRSLMNNVKILFATVEVNVLYDIKRLQSFVIQLFFRYLELSALWCKNDDLVLERNRIKWKSMASMNHLFAFVST